MSSFINNFIGKMAKTPMPDSREHATTSGRKSRQAGTAPAGKCQKMVNASLAKKGTCDGKQSSAPTATTSMTNLAAPTMPTNDKAWGSGLKYSLREAYFKCKHHTAYFHPCPCHNTTTVAFVHTEDAPGITG